MTRSRHQAYRCTWTRHSLCTMILLLLQHLLTTCSSIRSNLRSRAFVQPDPTGMRASRKILHSSGSGCDALTHPSLISNLFGESLQQRDMGTDTIAENNE